MATRSGCVRFACIFRTSPKMETMMHRPWPIPGHVAYCTLLLLIFAPSSVSARTHAAAQDLSGHFAPLSALDVATTMADSGVIAAGSCKYKQAVDNAHPSANPR